VKSPPGDSRRRLMTEGQLNSDSAESKEMPGGVDSSKNVLPPTTPVQAGSSSAEARMLHTPTKGATGEEDHEHPRPGRKHRSHFARDPSEGTHTPERPTGLAEGTHSRKSRSFFYPPHKPSVEDSIVPASEPLTDDGVVEDPVVQATTSVALGRKIDKLSKLTGRRGSLSEIRPLLESKTVEQARSNAQSLYQVEKLKKRYGDRPIMDSGEVAAPSSEPHVPSYPHSPSGTGPVDAAPVPGMHIATSPLQQQQTVSHKHRKPRDRDKDKSKEKK